MQQNPNRESMSVTSAAHTLGMMRGWFFDDSKHGLRARYRSPKNAKRKTLRTWRKGK